MTEFLNAITWPVTVAILGLCAVAIVWIWSLTK